MRFYNLLDIRLSLVIFALSMWKVYVWVVDSQVTDSVWTYVNVRQISKFV